MWITAKSRGVRSHALGVLDQVLFSTGALILGVLLARWLDQASYGEFTLASALILFLGGLYNALIIEPMSILGPARHDGVPHSYFVTLVLIHLALSGCLLGVVVLGLAVAQSAGIVRIVGVSANIFLLASTVVTPSMMLFWLIRRRAYAMFTVARALRSTVTYVAVLISGVAMLGWAQALTLSRSLWILVIAALLGSLVDTWSSLPALASGRVLVRARREVWTVLRQHWTYGSWAVLASVMYWGNGNLYYYLTGSLVGLSGVATLRVVAVCLQPVRTIQAGVVNVLLPTLAAARKAHDGHQAFKRHVAGAVVLFVALTVTYATLLAMSSAWVLRLLYGGRYDDAAVYVPILAVGAVIDSLGEAAAVGLKALEEPRLICVGYAIGSVATLIIGIPAIGALGTLGAAYAAVGSSIAFAVSVWLMYRARARREIAVSRPAGLREGSAFGNVEM
jgi:O-antigen/teichoic acid export membrane protein